MAKNNLKVAHKKNAPQLSNAPRPMEPSEFIHACKELESRLNDATGLDPGQKQRAIEFVRHMNKNLSFVIQLKSKDHG